MWTVYYGVRFTCGQLCDTWCLLTPLLPHAVWHLLTKAQWSLDPEQDEHICEHFSFCTFIYTSTRYVFFVHSSLGVANWLGGKQKTKKKNSITTRCKKHKAQRTMLAVLSDSFVLTPQNITLQLTLFLIATRETVMITSSKCLCSWIWILSVVSTPVKQIYLCCYILLSSAGTHHSGKQQNRALKEFATSVFKKKIQKH